MGTELTEAVTSASEAQSQQGDGSNKKGGGMGAGYVNLRGIKEKAAEEGGTRRGRIQLEPSGIRGIFLGIMRHP